MAKKKVRIEIQKDGNKSVNNSESELFLPYKVLEDSIIKMFWVSINLNTVLYHTTR